MEQDLCSNNKYKKESRIEDPVMILTIQYQSLQFFFLKSVLTCHMRDAHSWGMPIGSLQLEMNEPNPHTIHLFTFFLYY